VAKKRAIGRYPKAFRKMAVERLKRCENIVALSEELGVLRPVQPSKGTKEDL
jgi:hypothetical protein